MSLHVCFSSKFRCWSGLTFVVPSSGLQPDEAGLFGMLQAVEAITA